MILQVLTYYFIRFARCKATYFLCLCKSIVRASDLWATSQWFSLSVSIVVCELWCTPSGLGTCLLIVHSTSESILSLLLPFLSIPSRLHAPSPRTHPPPRVGFRSSAVRRRDVWCPCAVPLLAAPHGRLRLFCPHLGRTRASSPPSALGLEMCSRSSSWSVCGGGSQDIGSRSMVGRQLHRSRVRFLVDFFFVSPVLLFLSREEQLDWWAGIC